MEKNRQVVLIMTDTQRHDMVSCYADNGLKTPNIDRIAENGVRFQKAYTTQPVCQPARAGIFTGMFPSTCGSFTNSVGISDNIRTIGKRLEDKRIHTAFVGKWHLDGGDYFGLGKCPEGFDESYWFDMKNYLDAMTDDDRLLSRTAENMHAHAFDSSFTYAHQCTDRAVDFLEKHGKEDFFLTVSYDEPHDPYICPREFWEQYEDYRFPKSDNVYDTLEGKPAYQQVWADGRQHQDKSALEIVHPFYFGCNSYVDTQIGRVLDAVEAIAPDAVVIYTSDHGDFLHSHSLTGKGPAVYEEITHIPMLIQGRGIPNRVVDESVVSHIDIAPTIFELMGFEVPKIFQGKSLVPQLLDPAKPVNSFVFMEFGRYEVDHDGFGAFQPLRAAYDGRFKLSVNLLSTDELYDLKEDPAELVNLIEDETYAKIRNSLHDAIIENMNRCRDPFRGYYWECRPWRKDARTPSWGYTGMTRQREDEDYEERQLDYSTGLPMKDATRKK